MLRDLIRRFRPLVGDPIDVNTEEGWRRGAVRRVLPGLVLVDFPDGSRGYPEPNETRRPDMSGASMASSPPIESKVLSSSLTTLGASMVVAALNAVATHSTLLGGLPALAQFVILAVIPPALTFLSGYVTSHTPRPDLYTYGEPAEPWLPQPPEPEPEQEPVQPFPPTNPYPDAGYADVPYNNPHLYSGRGRHSA